MHNYSAKNEFARNAIFISAFSSTVISSYILNITREFDVYWLVYPSPIIIFGIIFYFVDNWVWKLPFLQRVFGTPNLSGDWEGTLTRNIDGNVVERKIKLKIDQSFTKIAIRFTGESSQSRSSSAHLDNSNKNDVRLTWNYFAEDKSGVTDHNKYGHGTTMVDIEGDSMSGIYFSTKKSRGGLRIERVK